MAGLLASIENEVSLSSCYSCVTVLFLVIRADEQEKLSTNGTIIQNGKNITQNLDTDFYLGIYGGNTKMHFNLPIVKLLQVLFFFNKETILFGFTGLTLATFVFGFIRNMALFNVLVRCAQSLHDRMFTSILKTPVRFFDINPIGKLTLTFIIIIFKC